ncbi:MAG: DUF6464 family protein [Cyanobacteria bacterium J06648_16]
MEQPQPEQRDWLLYLFQHHQREEISFSSVVQGYLLVIPLLQPSAVELIDDVERFDFSTQTPIRWSSPYRVFSLPQDCAADWPHEVASREIRRAIEIDRRFYPPPRPWLTQHIQAAAQDIRRTATRVLEQRREAARSAYEAWQSHEFDYSMLHPRSRCMPSIIGEPTCRNNARDQHLRCAINPSGPCEGCPDYELPKPAGPAGAPLAE